MVRDGGDGWRPWETVPRIAIGGVLSIPIVVGFVALGAVVVVIRSVREVMRETWSRVPLRRGAPLERVESDSDAA